MCCGLSLGLARAKRPRCHAVSKQLVTVHADTYGAIYFYLCIAACYSCRYCYVTLFPLLLFAFTRFNFQIGRIDYTLPEKISPKTSAIKLQFLLIINEDSCYPLMCLKDKGLRNIYLIITLSHLPE